jgi:GNAT superfamily N-acetyltransferase
MGMEADFSIRIASPGDLEMASVILEEARIWLAARGIDQWTGPFDAAWLASKIEAHELFIVERNAEPVGVFRLLWEDRLFWGDRERGESAYIHSLAIRRSHAGTGLGSQILAAIATLARERNRANLRLDCVASNHRLIAYYQAHAFTPIDTVTIGDFDMTLMERPL